MSRTRFTLHAASLALVAASSAAFSQGQWTQPGPANPPSARAELSMVTLGDQGILLFGGRTNNTGSCHDDTYFWDGTDWNQLPLSTHPTGRCAFAMSYDPLRGRTTLFSGWDAARYPQDTWEFDGSNWVQMTPATQPLARDWSGMAYHPATAATILFGGHDWQVGVYGDTWSWDGLNWTQLSPPAPTPPARSGHVMALDEQRGTILLFGGGRNDMWEWNGNAWVQLFPATMPPDRSFAAMAYDSSRQRMVLFGGKEVSTSNVLGDMWEWDGTDWTQMTTSSGPALSWPPMAYDPIHYDILVQGGSITNNRSQSDGTTWAWSGPGDWSNLFNALAGQLGEPRLAPRGTFLPGTSLSISLTRARPSSPTSLIVGGTVVNVPVLGGTLVPAFDVVIGGLYTNGNGEWTLSANYGYGQFPGIPLIFQAWILDPAAPYFAAASNAVMTTTR